MDLSTILDVPILQALGVVLLIALCERVGIPIISILKSIMKINGNNNVPEWAQELKKHFNEDTTQYLKSIDENIKVMKECQRAHGQKLAAISTQLSEFKEYGVPMRHKDV